MSAPRCLLVGAGRMAGGLVAPLLRDAGWEVVLVSRNEDVLRAVNEGGGLWLRTVGDPPSERWIGGVSAVSLGDPRLPRIAAGADLIATSVGPSALADVGRFLAPLLNARLASSKAPVNVLAFENHRRAPEVLLRSLARECPQLAGQLGRRFGIGGVAAWRAISHRQVTSAGVRFDADAADECYAGAVSLVPGAAPLDGSTPGIETVRSFDDRMLEKLWTFNAGHAAAAYLGWHAGCETVDGAMARPEIRASVAEVVVEAQQALEAHLATRPGSDPLPCRPLDSILDRYADPALADSVTRVAREPRRKLAPDDRLIGPAIACLSAGIRPYALAATAAAALTYGEPTDPQATDLGWELRLLEPEEVISTVSMLDPMDEFTRLVCDCYRYHALEALAA